MCRSHLTGSTTVYDYAEQKRVHTCCQSVIDFSKQSSKGCQYKFYEPLNPPDEYSILVPQRYKLIREENISQLDNFKDIEFINPESVNGTTGLYTFKSSTVHVI